MQAFTESAAATLHVIHRTLPVRDGALCVHARCMRRVGCCASRPPQRACPVQCAVLCEPRGMPRARRRALHTQGGLKGYSLSARVRATKLLAGHYETSGGPLRNFWRAITRTVVSVRAAD